MRALPARRIALGALCAALLAGVTGPAAMAADTRPTPTEPLAQVRTVDAREHGLTPVVDLLNAVLGADDGRLPAEEARRLGDAARAALAMPADDDPATTIESSSVTTNDTSLTEADLTSEEATALREVLDGLLALLRPEAATATGTETETDTAPETTTDTAAAPEAPSVVDELVARAHDLVAALLGTGPQASTLPAPASAAEPARTPLLPGVTLPALTSVLVPSS
ncbi:MULTISPECIES: hypothetical protein [Streptomyces]|uniref:Secreted protein n=1 Tax=Streptomyces edwardsiae TaxID=3075527 RepID=A0ABU2PUU6_9ACTN|nr:hypothetical protein [Streptomyces sp. DSM 41636]MDT0395942.1 hypothetical protein [Streptomyces sp. DSM 41636]